jgi:hypothetical protein
MDEDLPFNMRTPAVITPKPNVPKPKFKPSRQNVETLINILRFKNDGTQIKLPPEVTQPIKLGGEVLPPIYERLIQKIQENFDGAKSDFDDLLLEAALPCKRFWFENAIIRDSFTVRVKHFQKSLVDGLIDIQDANDMIDATVNGSIVSLIVPMEEVEDYILKNKDGIGIGIKPGENTDRSERPPCAEIVTKVGEALNDPKNQGRNGKVVRREVWNSLINKQYGVGRFLHRKHTRLTKKSKKTKKRKTRKYIR